MIIIFAQISPLQMTKLHVDAFETPIFCENAFADSSSRSGIHPVDILLKKKQRFEYMSCYTYLVIQN